MPQQPVGVPLITFLYTLDQVAGMIQKPLAEFRQVYVYYHLRNTGRKPKHQIFAYNIAPDGEQPEWRISHQDFVRWLRANGFSVKELADL